jgi:effector-binding domain-containing protein
MKIIIFVIAVLILWSIWGYFASRAEQAQYSVLEKKDGYEIREYAPHIIAQTTVTGDYNQSMNSGFRTIAGYIFGGNTKKESIAMTVPVITNNPTDTIGQKSQEVSSQESEKIAMTVPVIMQDSSGTRTMSFVMPAKYTLETLPVPNDINVKLIEVPKAKKAALRFSGYRSQERIEKNKSKLLELLVRDGLETAGEIEFAAYNGPGTPPWMNRHEVMINIK